MKYVLVTSFQYDENSELVAAPANIAEQIDSDPKTLGEFLLEKLDEGIHDFELEYDEE